MQLKKYKYTVGDMDAIFFIGFISGLIYGAAIAMYFKG